ncbi:MAG: CCDC81-like prokaryotic domain 1, partial [Bacteroidota bacterium]
MQGFEEILIELLLRHNCVVVPGFGGFVAKQIS